VSLLQRFRLVALPDDICSWHPKWGKRTSANTAHHSHCLCVGRTCWGAWHSLSAPSSHLFCPYHEPPRAGKLMRTAPLR